MELFEDTGQVCSGDAYSVIANSNQRLLLVIIDLKFNRYHPTVRAVLDRIVDKIANYTSEASLIPHADDAFLGTRQFDFVPVRLLLVVRDDFLRKFD
jgi:hypothetical protein